MTGIFKGFTNNLIRPLLKGELMNDQQLRSFLAASSFGSFTRAAKEENLAVQALAHRINTLEADVGFPLFIRTAHGVEPTPEGAVFAQAAQQALDILESGMMRARSLSERGSSLVRVGHPWRLAPAWQRLFISFCEENPDITIEYVPAHDGSPFEDLINQRYDLTPLPYGINPLPEEVESQKICETRCLCAFSPKSTLAGLSAVSSDDLKGKKVLFGFNYHTMKAFSYLKEWPPELDITIEPMSGEKMILKCLENPDLVVLFSEDTLPLAVPPLSFCPITPAVPYPAGLYYRKNPSKEIAALIDYATQRYRDLSEIGETHPLTLTR